MRRLASLAIAALLAASAAQSQFVGNNPGKGDWGPGPAGTPRGVKMIVLSGDPAKTGPYTIRLRFSPGARIAPHRHASEERLTVITGGFEYVVGPTDKGPGKYLTRGMSAVVPANTYMSGSTAIGATVEFTGTGPYEIEYSNAKDDPRNQ